MAMDGKASESPGPRQRDKSLPGHDIFCTPENSNFLSETPYSALDPTQREIRLLKVLPDSGSGFVECELLPSRPVAELRGEYWALSYCAGDPRNTEFILINGIMCNVFANLCHALTCARYFREGEFSDRDFLLWADQICINQADLLERSHQVGFMRDIYQSAEVTLVCLSSSKTQSQRMENLNSRKEQAVICRDMVESPWWSRAWVFQEFLVSSRPVFLFGYYHTSFAKMFTVLQRYLGYGVTSDPDLIPQLPDSGPDSGPDTEAAGKVRFMLRTKAEWKDTDSLAFLLARSRNSQASDDRDLIYAFLGLVDPRYGIIPDYSASNTLCHVLTETTKNIILFESRFNVLSLLDTSPRDRRPGLPSWVVDWTRERIRAEPLDDWRIDNMKHTSRGEGQAIASFRETTHPETLQATTVMEVTGVCVKKLVDADRPEDNSSTPEGHAFPTGNKFVKSGVLEVWYLCGSPFQFVLERKSYGYRIVRWFGTSRYGMVRSSAERKAISIF